MNEREIGIAYCLIAIVHLIAEGIRRQICRDFSDPELTVARVVTWPITDALWLVRRWQAWRATAIIAIAAVAMAEGVGGCTLDDVCAVPGITHIGDCPYRNYLHALPTTERIHNGEAIAIVARVYGIDYRIPEVRWVVQEDPLLDSDGGPALGLTYNCVSWVWWPPLFGPNPRNSRTFGHTVMSHEIAHCALWLYRGDGDGDHSDVEWWGPPSEGRLGGLVGVAMDELIERGM